MQNSLKALVFFFVITFLPTVTCANDYRAKMYVSLVGMSMDYREYNDNGVILDSEKSDFIDVFGSEIGYIFYFLSDEVAYSQIDINLMSISGKTEYVGALLHSEDAYGSYKGKTNNSIEDISGIYRYNFILNDAVEFNAGIGLGFRYWIRGLSSVQEETYYWLSLRPSLGMKINIIDALYLAPVLEYQYGILPSMKASGFDSAFKLSSADIIKFSLPISYEIGERIEIFTAYTFEQQKIGRSENINKGTYYYYEPDSTANNQYIKFGVAFKY